MSSTVLADALGPRGRRRVRIYSGVAVVVLVALVAVVVARLRSEGQLEPELYTDLFQREVFDRLAAGVVETLQLAITAIGLAIPIGLALALGRLARNVVVRNAVGSFVEFFRALPVLLLIFLSRFGLPQYGIDFSDFWFIVIALVAYNAAVLAEIFRAGILSLDRGQSEAAYTLGLTYGKAMRLVVLPQALRRMQPAILSQLVTLIKDTSLAYIISYPELLNIGGQISDFFDNRLQSFVLIALIFIAINFTLSRAAARLEIRQRRRLGAGAIDVTGGPEDLVLVEESKEGR